MLTAEKFAIRPGNEQKEKLFYQFGTARWIYNKGLEWKEDHACLKEIASQDRQQSILHLNNSFKHFFQKRSKFSKFKNKHSKQSISYPREAKIDGNKIYLPKIGWIKDVLHREVIGKIKTVTVSKNSTDKYHVSMLMENENTIPNLIKHTEKVIGIGVEISHFLTNSIKNNIENPRFLKKAIKNLRIKQKSLSRKRRGSKNRAKVGLEVAKFHEKISNARNDFHYKVSKTLADENQSIGIKALHIKGIQKNRKLAKSISDIILKYKRNILSELGDIKLRVKNVLNTITKCKKRHFASKSGFFQIVELDMIGIITQ